jgi:COP9 signalosome complex subunit 1
VKTEEVGLKKGFRQKSGLLLRASGLGYHSTIVQMSWLDPLSEAQRVVASYSDHPRLSRLLCIAQHCPKHSAPQAMQLLISQLLQSEQTEFYRKQIKPIENDFAEVFAEHSAAIKDWQTRTDEQLRCVLQVAENELRAATSSLVKESIRQALFDIVCIYLRWGRHEDAMKELLRSRDHCSSPLQHCQLHLQLLSLSIYMGHYINSSNFLHRVIDVSSDPIVLSRTRVAGALLALHSRDFQGAAEKLLQIELDLGNTANDLLSAGDIGFYIAVCALASFDRAKLRSQVLEKKVFLAKYLHIDPLSKTLANAAMQNDYKQLLQLLPAVRERMAVDVHLRAHAESLCAHIESQALRHFLRPFSELSLDRASKDLGLSVESLVHKLVALIQEEGLDLRIDLQTQRVLRVDSTNSTSSSTTSRTIEGLLRQHLLASKGAMFRLSVAEQKLFGAEARDFPFEREDNAGAATGATTIGGAGGSSGAGTGGIAYASRAVDDFEEGESEGEADFEDDADFVPGTTTSSSSNSGGMYSSEAAMTLE